MTTQPDDVVAASLFSDDDRARFWWWVTRSLPDECWPWGGSLTHKDGYGTFKHKQRAFGAHRVAYLLTHPEESLTRWDFVCHRCDNPPCCNPLHLFRGRPADNTGDAQRKGRLGHGTVGTPGELSGYARFTWPEVDRMRERYVQGGVTYAELAREYGVNQSSIAKIITGRTWKPEKRHLSERGSR